MGPYMYVLILKVSNFLPALVRMYNAGLSFALLFFFFLGSQTLLKILHYCPISPCFQHIAPLHSALPGSLARQPCPAALPRRLAPQPCPSASQKSLQAVGRHACSIAYLLLLLGRQFSSRFPRN
jgi:hypothetical protein